MNITGEIGSEEELTTDEPRTPRKNPLNVPGVTLHAPPCPACGGTKKSTKARDLYVSNAQKKYFGRHMTCMTMRYCCLL